MTPKHTGWNRALAAVCVFALAVASWYLLKRLTCAFMAAIGADWYELSGAERLNVIIGLAVGVVGLLLTTVATLLALVQFKAWRDQVSRRVKLKLVSDGSSTRDFDQSVTMSEYEVAIWNSGQRMARDVYWRLWFPQTRHRLSISAQESNVILEERVVHDEDGHPFVQCVGRYDGPVYTGLRVPCARVIFRYPKGTRITEDARRCEYVLECEDGRFPPTDVGVLELGAWMTLTTEDLASIPDAPEVRVGCDYVDAPVDNKGHEDEKPRE